MSKIAKVKQYTIENGNGIRLSIFFSGCNNYCKNCHNKELWDFDIGEDFDYEYYKTKIKPLINDFVNGCSILGGEPIHPINIFSTAYLVYWLKKDFPNKTIWVYTGYSWEELLDAYKNNIDYRWTFETIFHNIDVLVDGRFIEDKKELRLPFRGSSNQRIIDVKETLKKGEIILYEK